MLSTENPGDGPLRCRINADGRRRTPGLDPEACKTLVRQDQPAPAGGRRSSACCRRQLDLPRAQPRAQGDPDRQGPGRGGRGLYLYSAAETLGTSRDQMLEGLHGAAPVQLDLQLPDPHLGRRGRDRLTSGAAIMNQIPCAAAPTGPLARAMVRVCKEESFHQRRLRSCPLVMMQGAEAQKAMVQHGEPLVVGSAWPCSGRRRRQPDGAGRALGHQSASATTTCARTVNTAVPAQVLGVALPDPDLSGDEARQHYDYGQIDWAEFWTPSKAAPATERLSTPVKAHNDGQWVRDAALAYTRKQQQRAQKEAASTPRTQGMAPLGSLRPRRAGPRAQALRQPARRRRLQALRMARDVYAHHQEGVSIWVVPSTSITASNPRRQGRAVRPAADRSTATRPSAIPEEVGTCNDLHEGLPAGLGRRRRGAGPAQRRGMVRPRPRSRRPRRSPTSALTSSARPGCSTSASPS